jgi:hypothetical protein
MDPDLSDADITVLVDLLKRTIDDAHYPLSPRVTRWREVLAKLRPEPAREPLPPRKVYEPPSKGRWRRRGRRSLHRDRDERLSFPGPGDPTVQDPRPRETSETRSPGRPPGRSIWR